MKLNKNNVEDILSLTPLQSGILFHCLKSEDTESYFEQLDLKVTGQLDLESFKKAWEYIVERNEMLRTVYVWKNIEKPVQIILKKIDLPIICHDLSLVGEEKKAVEVEKIKIADREKGFDLEKGPLIRFTIVKLNENTYEIIISNHHILYDGWSNGIILKEFFDTYERLIEGKELSKNTKTPFKQYLYWLNSRDKKGATGYWQRYLAGFDSITPLPFKQRIKPISTEQGKYSVKIPYQLTEVVRKNKVTPAALFYAVWGMILHRTKNTSDVIFGTTLSGRPSDIKDIEEMVGLFINTLPLRINIAGKKRFMDLVKEINKDIAEREDFASTPLTEIQACSEIKNEDLFDTIMVIENYPLEKNLKDNKYLKIESFKIFEKTNYPLALGLIVLDEITLTFNYDLNYFKEKDIIRLTEYFKNILAEVTLNSNIFIKDIKMLSTEERELLLFKFNETEREYPKTSLIHHLIEEQVQKTPQNTALIWGEKKLTYAEYNKKADEMCEALKRAGIRKSELIALIAEPSIEMVVAIFGIWKAGCAYLPIDPAYPKKRIEYMLADSGVKRVLIQGNLSSQISINLSSISGGEKREDGDWALYTVSEDKNSNTWSEQLKTDDKNIPAYVIYTSGSTGEPKGVLIPHRGIVNTIYWRKNAFKLNSYDRALQLFSFSFDGFLVSFLTPLVSGATLVLLNREEMKDPLAIKGVMSKERITHFTCVPSLFSTLLDCMTEKEMKNLRLVSLAGEALSVDLVNKAKNLNPHLVIINEYGPTENSVSSTAELDLKPDGIITIGKPNWNTKVYILNDELSLLPLGTVGEICLSGKGLALSYINKPSLTKEKFVTNPFEKGQRMYRTGDLARWLEDGRIQFIGRKDSQVKIRGFRIETGEIERYLGEYPLIKQAVVLPYTDSTNSQNLCAYLLCNEKINEKEIISYLKKFLPQYMIPSEYVFLSEFPLTPAGKIDKKALKKPIITDKSIKKPLPDEVELKLFNIWSKLLGVEYLDKDSNFFTSGGNSLKVMSLVSLIYREFGVEIPVKKVFEAPTIEELAEIIKESKKTQYKKIPIAEKRNYYPLSSAQKRIYLTCQLLSEDSVSYNMPGAFIIKGKLDIQRFIKAFRKIIERHESLRTSFKDINGEPVQIIHPEVEFKVDIHHGQDKLHQFMRPFDLNKPPLLRVELIKLSEENHICFFDMHHIISDGLSVKNLVNEFLSLYKGEELKPLEIQYKDFALWQIDFFKSDQVKRQKEYWLQKFAEDIPVLEMPLDYLRPVKRSFRGSTLTFNMDKQLTEKLKKLAQKKNVTLFMLLLAIYNTLLAKYTGQEDIVVGTPVAGRNHPDLKDLIGVFVNMLPLRNEPAGSKTFAQFLQEVKENILTAFDNQDYQYEMLIEDLNLKTGHNRNPLFDTVFSLENFEMSPLLLTGLKIEPYPLKKDRAKFDLTLTGVIKDDELSFEIEYGRELFSALTIKRFIEHFKQIINTITEDADVKISEIEIITSEEKKMILSEFNKTSSSYPAEKTLAQLFIEQVNKNLKKPAVSFDKREMSYEELNWRSTSLARRLKELGIKANDIVALMVERSFEMIIAIFGILKAGSGYLPIDPSYPQSRIEYILNDSGASILLTTENLAKKINFPGKIIDLKNDNLYQKDEKELKLTGSAKDLAYIIYTSGTTGKPKGTMINQYSVTRLIKNTNYIEINPDDRILQVSNYAFDGSVFDIFGALLNGATLVLIPQEKMEDILNVAHFLEEEKITVVFMTTALFNLLIDFKITCFQGVRKIIFGGERASYQHVLKAFNCLGPGRLINAYGPTEGTVFTTTYSIDRIDEKIKAIPIGKPISNTTCYVLDGEKSLTPIGIVGELYIGGDGLARGYLNNPELTAERFIPDPFNEGRKLYKTGDLVKTLPDGNLIFISRADNQVKIRGFRIEPGEIENKLLKNPEVKEVVVVVKENTNGNKILIGYIVSDGDRNVNKLRLFLEKELPRYMIPDYFVFIDKIPLTPNGKVDFKSLPEPETDLREKRQDYIPPGDVMEAKMAKIWSKVLGITKVGIRDNFFDLGGHSLNAGQVVLEINKEFNLDISIRDLFNNPTISELTAILKEKKRSNYCQIPLSGEKEYYELSFNQKRLWYIYQLNPRSIAYNMPGRLRLNEEINPEWIKRALEILFKRHQSLRTYFTIIAGKPVQKITPDVVIPFEITDLSSLEPDKRADSLEKLFVQDGKKTFDLEKPPLFRARLVKLSKDRYELIYVLHHIISDGWSMVILEREFKKLYDGFKRGEEVKLPPLKVQYTDYAAWQSLRITDERIKTEVKNFWKDEFSTGIPELSLPFDFEAETKSEGRGAIYRTVLLKEPLNQLKDLAGKYHASLFMVLLAGFKILLYRLTNEKKLVIGIPAAARDHVDLNNVVGFFVNTLFLKNEIDPGESFEEFLQRIQRKTLRVLEYQSYPLEPILNELNIPYPEIQVFFNMFNLQGMGKMEDVSSHHLNDAQTVKFALNLYLFEYQNGLMIKCHYQKNLFKPETIEFIISEYLRILSSILKSFKQSINELISQKKRRKLSLKS